MKIFLVLLIFADLIFSTTISFSQVKNCDISYLDSNNIRQSYFKVRLESIKPDMLSFSENGVTHKISLPDLKWIGYMEDSRSVKGMLIGAGIGVGIWITFAALIGSNGGGHPDFSVSFGEAVGGTLILGVIGGIIGGAIGGISNKKKYVNLDLSKMDINEKYEKVDQIFKKIPDRKRINMFGDLNLKYY